MNPYPQERTDVEVVNGNAEQTTDETLNQVERPQSSSPPATEEAVLEDSPPSADSGSPAVFEVPPEVIDEVSQMPEQIQPQGTSG